MSVILHIIVVGFHHAHGPIVEYAYPPFPGQEPRVPLQRLEVPEEWSLLPFLALPDGSHQSDEDFTYFHLPPPTDRKDVATTMFGISCNRQILTKDLLVKSDEFTRSSVQKAVIVLATQPIFGVLRQRLGVVTAAWFGQRDFSQTDILAQFYDSLQATVSENIPDSAFLMERRVLFFGYPVETLCTYQYSLMSLVPGLLKALHDTGSPSLNSEDQYIQSMARTPRHSTDKQQLFKYLGLPLHIFGRGAFFQPYLPLQQIDILQDPRTESYVIGTTNAIFLHNRDISADAIVNTEPGTIEYLTDSLSSILTLTAADRRWMDEIIDAVSNSGSGAAETEYAGSDDYLRAKFEEYILTLLSSVKHAQFTKNEDPVEGIGHPNDRHLTADYGMYFIRAWQQTTNYQLWNDYVDWELLNEIVVPGHPCQGNFSLSDVQRRLANQFKDMKLDKNLAPFKQSFSRAVTTSRERLTNVLDSMWQEFERLQTEEGGDAEDDPLAYSSGVTKSPRSPAHLIQSTSTHPAPSPNARAAPDSELPNGDLVDDAVVPPATKTTGSPIGRGSSFGSNFGMRPKMNYGVASSSSATNSDYGNNVNSTTSSRTGSPSSGNSNSSSNGGVPSNLSATLGPATAATAALGQRAAGMFSNVSSFFQSKKKEFLDAQREAEEQYQQRIHEHERKKRAMQERARATASTFTVPPTISKAGSQKLTRSGVYSGMEQTLESPTKCAEQPRRGSDDILPATSDESTTTPSLTTAMMETVIDASSVVSNRQPSSASQSPTLTRANGLMAAGENELKELEEDLREAIGSDPSSKKQQQQQQQQHECMLNAEQGVAPMLAPERSTTPTHDGASSPFMILSAPVSPADLGARIDDATGHTQTPERITRSEAPSAEDIDSNAKTLP
ncbi:late secretory pathway protein avl9 [Actinomortierella ambigua]|nr:late secretory pathway protein avl9 [Actinomortierella ambigua]